MISTILAIALPFASGVDADVSARVLVAPGIVFSLHSDSYYDQRERRRKQHYAQVQAERDADRRHEEEFDRRKWHGSQERHEQMRRDMIESNRQREQARASREQGYRDQENRDKDERNHRQDARNHAKDDQRHRQEDQQRQQSQRP